MDLLHVYTLVIIGQPLSYNILDLLIGGTCMREKQKRISDMQYMCVLGIMLLAVVGGICFYMKQPGYQLRQYITTLNSQDYESVYEMFYKDQLILQYSRKDMIKYMNLHLKEIGFIKVEKGKMVYEDKNKAFYEVIYYTQNNNFKKVISLGKQNGEWYVVCPFETSTLRVQAPEGAQAFVNGGELKPNQLGERSIEVLEGNYTVRIVYPNQLQEDYIEKVKVPQQTEVISPYTTIPVEIIAPKGTIVELAGIQKENQVGSVRFDKVLEGNYEMKIYDQLGYMEPMIKPIVVHKGIEPIVINEMALSEQGEAAIKTFLNEFYNVYLDCIRKGNQAGLEGYINGDNKVDILEDFSGWFIDYKQITQADMTIELDALHIGSNGEILVDVLEVVNLTNKEKADAGEGRLEKYKVTLRWKTELGIGPDGYYVKNRDIQESLVAQKDNKNNWVQY